MRRLTYVMGAALGGLVVLVLACAADGQVSLAEAARSVGLCALGYSLWAFHGADDMYHCGPVVAILATVLGIVFWLSAMVAGVVFVLSWAFRLALQATRRQA